MFRRGKEREKKITQMANAELCCFLRMTDVGLALCQVVREIFPSDPLPVLL